MKFSVRKRVLSLLLALIMVFGLVPVVGVPEAQAESDDSSVLDFPQSDDSSVSDFPQSKDGLRAENADGRQNYIDMPIEVLDFRGDGFLFQASSTFSTPYSLSNSSPRQVGGVNFPGSNENGPSGRSDDFRTVGLVEEELYKRNVVYTDATIHYIAAALSAKSYIPNLNNYPRMNRHFVQKVNQNLPKGDLDSTIGKLDPPVKGEVLLWEQVETCYDLAYYMLSSLWREVPTKDVLGQETRLDGQKTDVRYNLHVPELSRLRLYYVTNPDRNKTEYTYTSYYGTEIKDGYLYNSDTTKHGIAPSFTVMNGLGFEDPNFFGSDTDLNYSGGYGRNHNYGFTIHAYGGFVYSESANYYFNFSGDDDVYFYINGHLVCDLGGIHGETNKNVDVNSYAAELNLKDGQICTFDMFYAERHSTGINMQFYTNIQLMDTDVITGKQQYDSATGKQLIDGAAVNIGTETDYSFSLLNRRSYPVQDVSFDDPAIGITLSKGGITLNDETALTDIRVTYRSYDSGNGKVYEGAGTEAKSPTDLLTKIGAFFTKDNSNPMENCAYTYQFKAGDTLADLQALLAQGIPASCELIIYGFHRTVSGGLFTNTMTSSCVPLVVKKDENEQLVFVEDAPLPGTASCRIYGIDMGTVSVGAPLSYVIDYGKPLSFSIADAKNALTHDSGMISEFVGLTMNGENGAIKTEEPLVFTENGKGDWGTFTLSGDSLSYTPQDFMSGVESCYAVYRLKASSNNAVIAYVYTEVQIIPATSMYYEAESLMGRISYAEKITDKETGTVTRKNTWTVKETALNTPQTAMPGDKDIVIPDYSNRTDVLFFGFDNTDADAERYALSQYNGVNYDRIAWKGGSTLFTQSATIENGVLKIVPKLGVKPSVYGDGTTSTGLYPDCSNLGNMIGNSSKKALSYDPSGAEVLQIRFKMKNLDTKYDDNGVTKNTSPYMGLHLWCTDKNGNPFKDSQGDEDAARCIANFAYDPDILNSDEFVTWTVPLANEFAKIGTVWGVRVYFGSILGHQTKDGYLMMDYIYMGPADSAPYRETYGYDPSYEAVSELSNGASLYTEGKGVPLPGAAEPANFTQASFSFVGTGFDIISRTDEDQGTLRIEIFNKKECTTDDLEVAYTVNMKGNMKMNQIPVYSKEDLPYGRYWVKLSVGDKVSSIIPSLSRGNQFYLDGIIIHNPVDPTANSSVLHAYEQDGEAYAVVEEVRDKLLGEPDFNELNDHVNGLINGAVYIDYIPVPEENEDGTSVGNNPQNPNASHHNTHKVATYNKLGPNNEVYLAPQQAIAFKLVIYSKELPQRIDVGCKAIMKDGGILDIQTAKVAKKATGVFSRPLSGGHLRFFSLPLCEEMFIQENVNGKSCYTTYIVLRNNALKNDSTKEAVLSITDIKVAYNQKPTPASDAGSGSGAGASGSGIKSLGGIPTRDSVELPEDSFVPVELVVDAGIMDVIGALLTEFEVEETPIEEAEPGDLAFAGASVALHSDLAIRYKVAESFFTEQGYEDPFVVVVDENGAETVIREYTVTDGKYSFVYQNIAPHRIGDKVTATLYAYYNGELYCSESRDYSVADYCYNMLGKTEGMESYETLRRLLVDILLYGAKTQEYMSYRCESLCSERLSPSQLACGTESCRELENHRNQSYETVENPTVYWKGAGLNLRESVAIRFRIEAESYEGLEVRITLAGKTYRIYSKDFDHRQEGTYVHFRSINAAQMSEPVYAAVFHNGVQVSDTVCYSIESYAYSKQNDTIPHLA
ncbi:MAG: fibro-slime domain-containing protein, partial [Oscillospiraceae bacterium]|nr:fibro-slime domain-containing protein [Oscillospiraceae bacterium]